MGKFNKFLIATSVALFNISAAFAGELSDSLVIKINWLGIHTFGDTADPSHTYLYFDGARYNPGESELPSFSLGIPLADNEFISRASLGSPVYCDLLPDEVKAVRDTLLIGTEPLISIQPVTQRNQTSAEVVFYPFRKDPSTGKWQKLLRFSLMYDKQECPAGLDKKEVSYAAHSVLSQGHWIKLKVKSTGIYKLTYGDLLSMGLSPADINPLNIRIYGNGGGMLPEGNSKFRYDDLQENAICVVGEQDGSFDAEDYILFYGQSADAWVYSPDKEKYTHLRNYYSDDNYYFLTVDAGQGKRIQDLPSVTLAATHQADNFDDFAAYDKDSVNLIKSGKTWYGEKFDLKLTYDLPLFTFPNLVTEIPLRLDVDLAARSTSASLFKIYANGNELISLPVASISPAYNADYASTANASTTFPSDNPAIQVKVRYFPPVSGSTGYLNYVECNAVRHLIFTGDQMAFRNSKCTGAGNITDFTLRQAGAGISIWDVTDPVKVKKVLTQAMNNTLGFRLPTDSLREFIAFNGASYLSISGYQVLPNQDLHSMSPQDMIIITPARFSAQAEEVASIHRNEGLSVAVVTPGDIYNEFSSGRQDISALRDFVRMIYKRCPAGQELRYLLLFGDGSYDYKDRLPSNTNFIPSFQSLNSLRPTESYVTDDFFGLMDDGEGQEAYGTLDIGIGRFPVDNEQEAEEAVTKIKKYLGLVPQTPGTNFANSVPRLGDWRNLLCFVADDEDNNRYLNDSEDITKFLDTTYRQYNIDKIYFDAYRQLSTPGGQRYPDVTADINKRLGKGALMVNYIGHGGETGWAHERVLEVTDINAWNNEWDAPVFLTATCEFSRFDDPGRVSAGEFVFLNPVGGAICLFTTSRLSMAETNFALNMNFYKNVFKTINGQHLRMGDAVRLAKTPSNIEIRNFVLLGDPAIAIVTPKYKVATTTINGKPVEQGTDTIKAYSNVTVTGNITDENGNTLTGFTGLLYPVVFDKPAEITTLANDESSYPCKFLLQKNILYKGKVSVTNGAFSFTFMVPRDIAYKYGVGKISYYAQNGMQDAHGYYDNIVIGGSEEIFEEDNQGPSVQLFLNDTNFRPGGITDQNPLLLGLVSDIHGINTVGNGIGHDIVGILDENNEKSVVLNDYYQAGLDSYQSGIVRYPFSKLTEGRHTLRLKVWDIYNNSAEASTEFYVMDNGHLVLENLMNYPNPFIDQTSFVFNYNQPGTLLNVEIDIFSITGAHIRTIKETLSSDGFKAGPVVWDGTTDQGSRIAKGLYVYRVKVSAESGESVEKTSKLIVLK